MDKVYWLFPFSLNVTKWDNYEKRVMCGKGWQSGRGSVHMQLWATMISYWCYTSKQVISCRQSVYLKCKNSRTYVTKLENEFEWSISHLLMTFLRWDTKYWISFSELKVTDFPTICDVCTHVLLRLWFCSSLLSNSQCTYQNVITV